MNGTQAMEYSPKPNGWDEVLVRDVISGSFCGPSPDCEEREVREAHEWGVLKTTAITWAGWNPRAHKTLPKAHWNHPELEVRAGDVLVTKAGPRHRVGVVATVDVTPPHLIVSGKMIALRPNRDRVVPRILAAALSLPGPQRFIDHRSTGMAESQVNFANEVLLSTRLALPAIKEQARIAEVLDTLDEAIRGTESVVKKLQDCRAGLVLDLMKYGVIDHGEVRDPVLYPQRFVTSRLGSVPSSWRVGPLGDFITLQRGFDITQQEQREGPFPVVSSSGITSYHSKAMVDGPGVVIGRKGKLGGAHYLEVPFWPHDTTLWVKDFHGNFPEFCCHFLRQMRLERFDAATSVPTLNRNFVHPLPVAFPPVEEQERISMIIRAADDELKKETQILLKLRSIKSGLSSDLLTGRIRVSLETTA